MYWQTSLLVLLSMCQVTSLARLDIIHGPLRERVIEPNRPMQQRDRHNAVARRRADSRSRGRCKLPKCFMPYSGIPGGLHKDDTPMLVYFTFDDGITAWSNSFFERFFNNRRTNPNGCPIRATHFNSHDSTDYSIVRELYAQGHEIGSHSITHRTPLSWWKEASLKDWEDEMQGQRERIHRHAGVPLHEIRGSRAPFLQLGGDRQFTMLLQQGFTYDASMSAQTHPPSWPFTLQYVDLDTRLCASKPCPQMPYPLWEVPLNMLHMDSAHTPKCGMVDGCRPSNKEEALEFLWSNFRRHANADNKAPFGVNMHAAWFAWQYNADAMDEFIAGLADLRDVWIVPIYKVLQWIQDPTPVSRLKSFKPFQC